MIPALDGRASLDRGQVGPCYNVYPKLNDNVDMIETSIPYYRFAYSRIALHGRFEGSISAFCYRSYSLISDTWSFEEIHA